ncbi:MULTISPECIES: hypothetical protein [Paeniglutamicibacter]|uniref:Uncharacterized protein n=1 Tax=Paeniglutamicibacter sulfureus TaxID=43666 RepID=A0ABU2BGA5_9MICC|nr:MULTISPECIES: hypothetical protein [Paeniglutamicibacter]MCV9993067.1 hypothetical protein [Paeniglutamicibacter sp. ZC-3]MDO2933354.1 hypothetical protein [Paeniglutamicibacter sulfureus]MDR7357665.1 hypothetical protein [Paeniglutamicibacter sulfureus]
MPDKSPHRHEHKKPAGKSIKARRAEKRSKNAPATETEQVTHIKKH